MCENWPTSGQDWHCTCSRQGCDTAAGESNRRVVANAIYNHPNFWRYAERTNPPIHIIIEHQRITLTGVVDNQGDRILAQSLAQVTGVLSVENRLRVAMQ